MTDYIKDIPKQLYIGGHWEVSSTGETLETYDPATGEVIAEVAAASTSDVDRAVTAAHGALGEDWKKYTPAQRSRILHRIAKLVTRDAEQYAYVESMDCGKPMREARSDMATCARYFEYYSGIADKVQGHTIPLGQDYVSFTIHEPVGVTAHIIPWNFPLVTTARGLAPALAAGNTAVVKPAEETPLTALMFARTLEEAGVPAGVYNVVTGVGEVTGAAVTAHPLVSHITFTGSVETGKRVMKAAADHIASVTLELGGKSPIIVLADADTDSAVEGILKAIFMNSGQVCSAGSRLIIERSIRDEVMEKLVKAASGMRAGRGIDDPDLGPIITSAQLARIESYVGQARKRGVRVVTGGEVLEVAGCRNGCFFAPTILEASDAKDPVAMEEIFGPVLTVQVVDSPEEAATVANSTEFGLVAGIYSRDITKALRLARDVEAGQIFINQYFAGGVETPFGGVKKSGFGREKGLEALRNYYRVKCVTARI